MPLLKIPLLFALQLCNHISVTRPNPPPKPEEMIQHSKVLRARRYLRVLPTLDKLACWTIVGCECALIYAMHAPSAPFASDILPFLAFGGSPQKIRITNLFLVGTVLSVMGGLVRATCYRALGRFFTFELAIRDQHKLITSGPYSVVRHPSYTGALLAKTGVTISLFGAGSWMRECGILDTGAGHYFLVGWLLLGVFIISTLLWRTGKEDEMLKSEFGKQWDQWAKMTPYKLIPGLI